MAPSPENSGEGFPVRTLPLPLVGLRASVADGTGNDTLIAFPIFSHHRVN